MNNGKKLELDFVLNLNNHYYYELNLNLQRFIKFAFKDFDCTNKIYCKKLSNKQKADICVSIGDEVKYVSLKSGSQNSVHVEKVNDFIKFLATDGIEESIFCFLLLYHYGDDSLNGDGKVRYSAEECKIKYKTQILQFNRYINNSKYLTKIIERFLLIGTNLSNKYVDLIYYGDIDIGIWCTSKELLNFCINHKSLYMNVPQFSVFTYQNWCRNITLSKKSESHRNYMQVKWFSILSDINKIRKEKLSKFLFRPHCKKKNIFKCSFS